MKILIMVLSHKDGGIYDGLVDVIKNTWDNDMVDGFETIYYYSDNNLDSVKIIDKDIFIPCEDGIDNLGYKVLSTFEFVLNNFEFDYIFKMNCSSYLNKNLLRDLVIDKPRNKFYAGVVGSHGDINFVSGSGTLLSRDLVELILDNKDKWDHSLIEDVSIGKILTSNNVIPYSMNRIDIINGLDIKKINTICHHYRCKNDNNREYDIIIMKELYNIYKKN